MKSTCQKLNVLLIATRGVTDVDMLFTLNPVIVKGNYLSRQPTSYAVVVQIKRFGTVHFLWGRGGLVGFDG